MSFLMNAADPLPKRFRVPIAGRFWLVLGVLVVAMGVVGAFGFGGLRDISNSAEGLSHAVRETRLDDGTRADIIALRAGVQLFLLTDPGLVSEARRDVEATIARLELSFAEMERVYADEPEPLRNSVAQHAAVRRLVTLWRSGAFDIAGRSPSTEARRATLVRRVRDLLEPGVRAGAAHAARDVGQAAAALERAKNTYAGTRDLMIVVFSVTVLLAIGMFFWLIRCVVPRTRRYSRFAARISHGDVGERLEPRGGDELADLGRSLDSMVARHEDERAFQRTQVEFVDAMQVTESEEEAHQLIKRHVERSIGDSSVVVLNRNNSNDRLESRTAVDPVSALAQGLDGATPRSCLAVRFGRRHEGGGDRESLLSCEVCGKTPDLATCNPLLVGGEVIGSVLINHPEPLEPAEDMRVRESVTQAAPVLANLRNLAIAEMRASTDVLTGLPNNRAVQDTLKQFVAHASRAQSPLVAALLDLDHFKQINDTFGHGRGDEVLAAVAETMRAAVRASDFVGRYGGEEFLILLPDTDRVGGLALAEKVRAAIGQVTLPSIDRQITASIGIAVLPDDAIDSDTLVRNADRALYAAKSNGRNRVESAGAAPVERRAVAAVASANGGAPPA
jgi:diguanylate cyclase (GGDEF)-like protein